MRENIREKIREDLELFWKQKPFNKAPKTRVLVPLAWLNSNRSIFSFLMDAT